MKILTNYYKNGYDFEIVKRKGDLVIAKGISRMHGGENWEVFEVQSHNGMQMGDNWVEPSQFPAGNNQWGDKGWTALNESHAEEIFAKKIMRYSEIGESIFFHKTGCVFHKTFIRRFYGCDLPSARRKLKMFTHSQQDETIHYLKEKKIIPQYHE